MIRPTIAFQQLDHCWYKIISNCAANAAIIEFNDIILSACLITASSQDFTINPKITKLVDDQRDDFDGPRLRRARMHRGVEIDDIAQVTKVTSLYLQAIEDEAFETLPPAVYVRGFVSAYARAIGLDPKRVADSYILRLETAHREKGRGRILGRR